MRGNHILAIGILITLLIFNSSANGVSNTCHDFFNTASTTLKTPRLPPDSPRHDSQRQEPAGKRNSLESLITERGLVLANAISTPSSDIQTFLDKERARSQINVSKAVGIDIDIKSVKESYDQSYGEFLVIKNTTGEIVATAGLLRVGANEAEIRKVYVSEKVVRMGLGKILIQHL